MCEMNRLALKLEQEEDCLFISVQFSSADNTLYIISICNLQFTIIRYEYSGLRFYVY